MASRQLRRAIASDLRRRATEWPAQLAPVPEREWPAQRPDVQRPTAVWRSRDYLVQMFPVPPLNGIEVRRLSVNRCAITNDGHWEQDISWDSLQRLKRETGHGEWYAVEIYPRDNDLVYVANMRHLWLLAKPLGIGWFVTPDGSVLEGDQ